MAESLKDREACEDCGFEYHKTGYPFKHPSEAHDEYREFCHYCNRRVLDVCTFVPDSPHICGRCARPLVPFKEWLKSKQPTLRMRPRTTPTSNATTSTMWVMPLARL